MVSNLNVSRSSCDLNFTTSDLRATGFLTMKVGKVVAVVAGGSIILLQIAANEGAFIIYITFKTVFNLISFRLHHD